MSRHWPDKLGRRHRHRWRRCLLRRRLLVLWRRLHTGCSSGRSRLRSEGPPRHRRQALWRRNRKTGAGGHRSACGLRHSRFFRLRPSRVRIDCCARARQARLRRGIALGLGQSDAGQAAQSAAPRPQLLGTQGLGRRTFILFSLISRRLSREEEGGPPLQRSDDSVAEERAEATLLLVVCFRRPAVGVRSARASAGRGGARHDAEEWAEGGKTGQETGDRRRQVLKSAGEPPSPTPRTRPPGRRPSSSADRHGSDAAAAPARTHRAAIELGRGGFALARPSQRLRPRYLHLKPYGCVWDVLTGDWSVERVRGRRGRSVKRGGGSDRAGLLYSESRERTVRMTVRRRTAVDAWTVEAQRRRRPVSAGGARRPLKGA